MSKSERCGVTAHNRFTRVGGVRWAVSAFALAAAVCATFTTSSASAMHGTGGTVADPGAQRREPHGSHMVVTLPAART